MQRTNASLIESQLDLLARKGTKFIRQAIVGSNRHKALNNACLSLWFLPLLSLVLVFFLEPSIYAALGIFVFGMVAIPSLTYLLKQLLTAFRTSPSRQQSLALFDSQLGLKDDLQIVDEFLHTPSPTDFQKAALASCSESVSRALAHPPVPFPTFPLSLSGHQILLNLLAIFLSASILVVGTLVIHAPTEHTPSIQPTQNELTHAPQTIEQKQGDAEKYSHEKLTENPPVADTLASQTTQLSEHTETTSGSDSLTPALNSNAASEGSKAPATSARNSPANSLKAQTMTKRSASAAKLNKPTSNTESNATAQSESAPLGKAQESIQPDSEQRKDTNTPFSDNDATAQNEQQKSAELRQNSSAAAQQAQRKPKKQDSGKKNGQQQSSGSNPDSGSQNSSTQGDDAIKKSRGINQLMLSVPMEDQFIGTPGPGLEKSTTERQPVEEQPFKAAPSASRGKNTQSATIHQKPIIQSWEKQLMNDFFRQQHQGSEQNENTNDD